MQTARINLHELDDHNDLLKGGGDRVKSTTPIDHSFREMTRLSGTGARRKHNKDKEISIRLRRHTAADSESNEDPDGRPS